LSAGVATESHDDPDSIFSKGPSRAKRAKQKQKEQEERQKEGQDAAAHRHPSPRPKSPEPKAASRREASPPVRSRRSRAAHSPERVTQTADIEDERPLPTHTNSKQSTANRKPKTYAF